MDSARSPSSSRLVSVGPAVPVRPAGAPPLDFSQLGRSSEAEGVPLPDSAHLEGGSQSSSRSSRSARSPRRSHSDITSSREASPAAVAEPIQRPNASTLPKKFTTLHKVFFGVAAFAALALFVGAGVTFSAAFLPVVASFAGVSQVSFVALIAVGSVAGGAGVIVVVTTCGFGFVTHRAHNRAIANLNAEYEAAIAAHDATKAHVTAELEQAGHAMEQSEVRLATATRCLASGDLEAHTAEIQKLETELAAVTAEQKTRDAAFKGSIAQAQTALSVARRTVTQLQDRRAQLEASRAAALARVQDVNDRLYSEDGAQAARVAQYEALEPARAAITAAYYELRDAEETVRREVEALRDADEVVRTRAGTLTTREEALADALRAQATATAALETEKQAGEVASAQWKQKGRIERGVFSEDPIYASLGRQVMLNGNVRSAAATHGGALTLRDAAQGAHQEAVAARQVVAERLAAARVACTERAAARADAQRTSERLRFEYQAQHSAYIAACEALEGCEGALARFMETYPELHTSAEAAVAAAQAELEARETQYQDSIDGGELSRLNVLALQTQGALDALRDARDRFVLGAQQFAAAQERLRAAQFEAARYPA